MDGGVTTSSRTTAARVGMLAAVSLALFNLWFWIGFTRYAPILLAPWKGMSDYQHRFQPALHMAWTLPAFLFAPAFLAMITCIHAWAEEEQRVWTLLALAYAIPGATLMAALYYIEMTVVRSGLTNGTADALRLWIYAPPYPFTFPGALEGIGYGFEAAAFLLVAQVFAGDRLRLWLRWLFRASGLSVMMVFIDPLIRLPVPLVFADGGLAMILLSATPVLLAVYWWRSQTTPVAGGLRLDLAVRPRISTDPTTR